MSTEIIYTDGACSKNGTANAVGGFGMFIAKSEVFDSPLRVNAKGESMNFADETFYVTNIRMEGLAIVSTLAFYLSVLVDKTDVSDPIQCLNNNVSFDTTGMKIGYGPEELRVVSATPAIIEIVTDSQFWINVIESWMPSWIRKGIVMQKRIQTSF